MYRQKSIHEVAFVRGTVIALNVGIVESYLTLNVYSGESIMKAINVGIVNIKVFSLVTLLSLSLAFVGNGIRVLAHGGEDHGDSQSKTVPSEKGTISRTLRIGELEVMVKHPFLEPDTATLAKLFLTKYATNETSDKATAVIEIESSNGAVTQITVEKTDVVGSYNLKIPALPEGSYTMRAKITYAGETDTATFSGVKVEHPAAETATGMSWLRSILILLTGSLVFALFAGLIFFVWRFAGSNDIRNETVSA